jgi:Do/DeqQ family serine protease
MKWPDPQLNSAMEAATHAPKLRSALAGLALFTPIFSTSALASPPSGSEQNPIATANQLGVAFSRVAEQASPSVVSIQVEVKRPQPSFGFFFPFGGGSPDGPGGGIQKGGGSGMVLSADGAILTNNHVVDSASRITVALQDGQRFTAKVVGTDPATDLAVLKIDAKGLRPVKFADSDRAQVGEWVIAIGSPFGLDYSITAGVLSAKGRGGMGANEIEDYLQTDASINPGNSGGPLIDLDGNVLGINTMIIGHASGIGFAIPSNLARKVSTELLQKGDVSRAWIGVSYQELTPELASGFGAQRTRGALVNEIVPSGPAAKAGVRPGDIIIDIQGREVREGRDLLRAVLQYPVGEKLSLTVLRDGSQQKLQVVTAARPDQREARAGSGAKPQRGQAKPQGSKGMELAELTPDIARRIGYQGPGGVVIANVVPGSAADRAGLLRGDVIEEVNRKPISSGRQLEEALGGPKALLKVHRQGGTFFAALGD